MMFTLKELNKIRSFMLLIVFALAMILPSSFVHAKTLTPIRAGFFISNSPLMKHDENFKNKSGYAYEYLQAIGNYAGWKYEYVYDDFPTLYQQLLRGEIDLLVDVSRTPEREKQLLFPTQAMGREVYYLYVNKNYSNLTPENVLSNINGKSIAVTPNTIQKNMLIKWLADNNLSCNLVDYQDSKERSAALSDGTVDALLEIRFFADNCCRPVAEIGHSEYYVALAAGREDLLAQLNIAQENLRRIDPNWYGNHFSTYFRKLLVGNELTPEETTWLEGHTRIMCGIDKKTSLYLTDAFKEIMSGIISTLKLQQKVDVHFITYENHEELLAALNREEIQIAFPLYNNPEAADNNNYSIVADTNTFVIDSIRLKNDFSPVNRIAVPKGKIATSYVKEHFSAEIIECDIPEHCLDLVINGEADMAIMLDNGIKPLLKAKATYDNLQITQLGKPISIGFGVRNDENGLFMLLRRGASLLDTDFIPNTIANHNVLQNEYTAYDFVHEHIRIILLAVAASTAVFMTLLSIIKKQKLQKKLAIEREKEQEKYFNIIKALSSNYFTVYLVNGELDKGICYRVPDSINMLYGLVEGNEYPYSTTIERYIYDFIIPSEAEAMRSFLTLSNIKKLLDDSERVSKIYTSRFNGEEHYMRVTVARADVNQKQNHFIIGFADVDNKVKAELEQQKELRRALKRAEAASRAKSTFLSNMSHDMRTPMNAIIGFTNLAADCLDDKQQLNDYLAKINSSSTHLLNLINDILDMSRIESGKVTIKEEKVMLSTLIDELNNILETDIDKKQLTFTTNTDDLINPYVYCDKLRITQILVNCLNNAVKYTPDGGSITFTVTEIPTDEPEYSTYQFVIKDNGIGMSEEFLKHIFEPFERERTSTVSGIQGTGLGLSITKNVVEMMNGTIKVTSKEGEGSKFTIELPLKLIRPDMSADDDDNKSSITENVSIKDMPYHLLLVEDNELNAEIASTILTASGFTLDYAADGKIAVDMVSSSPAGTYDTILMDIQMPIMNGYEATQAIRALKDSDKADIPIIAMTANAFEEDKKAALQAGMNAHIAKPIDIEVMLNTLNEILLKQK